jgi:hydrogenase nickel incorporation protein HypA/HybF
VTVRVGPLSHFTPEHFRAHFADAAAGTVADGAIVEVDDGDGADVLVEAVEVEAG